MPSGVTSAALPYRKMVIGALPLLLDLDKQPILERWTSEDDDDEESLDEEEEFPELKGPFCTERSDYCPHLIACPGSHCPRRRG